MYGLKVAFRLIMKEKYFSTGQVNILKKNKILYIIIYTYTYIAKMFISH